MTLSLINIILIIIVAALAGIIILLSFRLSNAKSALEKKILSLSKQYSDEKSYLEKEIKRQQYLIEEIKRKNGHVHKFVQPEMQVAHPQLLAVEKADEAKETSYGRSFEADEEFREKNRKLWDLSIAIHKEKERIDSLKNQIEHRHNEVTKSITYAQRIQKALLPSSKILGVRFTDYFILWKPKDIVSGDFYWFKRLEDSMIIVVADCTGHGVPGAFMSLLGISFLNDILTKDKTLKSNQILDRLREMIKLALQQESRKKSMALDGMDMAIAIINHKSMELDFSGANNPLYLIRDNEIMVFKENRNPVGIHHYENPFSNHIFKLKKGDKLYMFSDGFIDQFGEKSGRKFLNNNFQRLLLHISSQNLGMDDEKEILEETLETWKGNIPQIDDILILGIKI